MSRAILMIAKRRAKVDDPYRHHLPDAADSDPREVLDYLQKYSGPSMPRWVLQADVCEALTLNNWLWWEDRRRGLYLTQIGAQVGVGKQGVIDRIDRLDALLRYDRPDEKISRAGRQAERRAHERRPVEDAWLDAHRGELAKAISDLLLAAERLGLAEEDREWLDELA